MLTSVWRTQPSRERLTLVLQFLLGICSKIGSGRPLPLSQMRGSSYRICDTTAVIPATGFEKVVRPNMGESLTEVLWHGQQKPTAADCADYTDFIRIIRAIRG